MRNSKKEMRYSLDSQTVAIFAVSCGLVLSHRAPRIKPSNPQNTLMVNPVTILKLVTKSIGALIWSGLGGNTMNAVAIIPT